jgi:hypothetical protein
MRERLGELRKAPWTLWAYVGFSASVTVVSGAFGRPAQLWLTAIVFAVGIAFGFFLLRGSRVMWWILVVLELGAIPFYFVEPVWWRAPITVVDVCLLLAPPSRRYVRPRRRKRVALNGPSDRRRQTSWDPDHQDDNARPPGWYFDSADPSRMRYWDPGLGGWQSKTTRAPRKLRRRAPETAAD